MVERQLLDQARSCLHGFLLAKPQDRSAVESSIRRLASEKVMSLVEDPSICKLVLAIVRHESLDSAFPSVN
jgi:DNA-binding TFAR19-related protein (PDSD5 family)